MQKKNNNKHEDKAVSVRPTLFQYKYLAELPRTSHH